MSYSQYKAVESMFDLLFFCFKAIILYGSFLVPGALVFVICHNNFNLHWLVSLIFGGLAAFGIYYIVAFLEIWRRASPKKSISSWVLLFITIVLISGIPFIIGMNFFLGILGKSGSLFEKVISGGFGGILFGGLSYFAVQTTIPHPS